MKYLFTLVLALVLCSVCYASDEEEYEIKSKYIDFDSNDGFMDKGSSLNPLVVTNDGNEIAEIKSKYNDLQPNDGFMDAGTNSNPYTIKFEKE